MRVRPAATLAALALAWTTGGCDSEEPSDQPDSGVSVVVSKQTVAPGESLKARVRNDSDEQVTYGLDYRLQRQVDGEFVEVDLPDRPVIQIALVARPGETGPPVNVKLPRDAQPGTWRVILATDPLVAGQFVVSG